MLVSRRKQRENRNITVYLSNKPLDQVTKMKYVRIIFDHKFRFQEHTSINYAIEKFAKLIHNLSKMAKVPWGVKHAAIATIQGDSGGICTTLGNGSMSDSKQKSSYEHGSDFERLRSYGHFLIPVHALM